MKKDILRLGLALALFAAGACVALAMVYTVTKPAIDGHEAKNLQRSLADLFPAAETFEDLGQAVQSGDPAVVIQGAWKAMKGQAVLGVAVKALGKSYGGDAGMLVGVGIDRTLTGIRILALKDTPGLGANATSPTYFVDKSSGTTFPGQFTGKPVNAPFKVKEDVQAITASTITSKALALIAKRAGEAGAAWLESAATGGK